MALAIYLIGERKAANLSRALTTELVDDPDLVLVLGKDTEYWISGAIMYQADTTVPDIKIAFTVPSGSVMNLALHAGETNGNSSVFFGHAFASGAAHNWQVGTAWEVLFISGSIKTGDSGGNFAFQWAQNISDADPTTVGRGSVLTAARI